MHETPGDIAALDSLLARSFAAAGPHLLDIARPERRLDGRAVSDRLTGMCLLVVATVTADHRPILGAVDGIFYRERFTSDPRAAPCGSVTCRLDPR